MHAINVSALLSGFDQIKHGDKKMERRSARELQKLLGYTERRNFLVAIERAKDSCKSAGGLVSDHFVGVNKSIKSGKGAMFEIDDFMLSRYACYLIAQNGDPRKQEIAFAQAYFAVQTRKQEVLEQHMMEYQRILSRQKLKATETEFQSLAYERGVNGDGISRIRSKGDMILFGGKTTQEMKEKYNIKRGPLADHLPEVTIKAKDLAMEVANYNMQTKDLRGEAPITKEHIRNNQGVRDYLVKSGIKPENLSPAEDLKKIEKKHKKKTRTLLGKGIRTK